MKYIHLLMVSISLLSICASAATAEKFIEQKKIHKSEFYTGINDTLQLTYLKPGQWLDNHQMEDRNNMVIQNKGFLIEHKGLHQEVTRIANRLLEQWPGRSPEIGIFITAQSSPMLYSAETSASDEIFLCYGVLLQAESEDEVAAVLAHELSHILLEHNDKLNYKKWASSFTKNAAQVSSLYSMADNLEYDKSSGELTSDEKNIARDLRKVTAQRKVAGTFYQSAHASLFSRSAELEADKLAVDLLILAGYSPRAMVVTLERIGHSYNLSTGFEELLMNSTQELMTNQVQSVSAAISSNNIDSINTDKALNDALKGAEIKGLDIALGFLSNSHPNTDKRINKVSSYLFAEYKRKDRSRPLRAESMAPFREGENARVLANIKAANESLSALFSKDTSLAEQKAKAAISGPTSNYAYTRYAAYTVRQALGERKLALINLERIGLDQWIPINESMELSELYINERKFAAAEALIKVNESYFGEIDRYYPTNIKLELARDNKGQATTIANACYEKKGIDSDIAEQCAALAGIEITEKGKNPFSKLIGFSKSLNK
jgi:Zn-dependent protease with chaperone function